MIVRLLLILISSFFITQTSQQFEEHYTKAAYIDGVYANVSPIDSRFLNWDTANTATFYFNINSNNDVSIKDTKGKYTIYVNTEHKLIPQYNASLKDTSKITFRESTGNFLNLTYYGNFLKVFNPKAQHSVTIYSR